MGKAVKSIGGMLGLGGSGRGVGTQIDTSKFDITKETAKARKQATQLLDRTTTASQAGATARPDVITAMGKAALGQGPSLAEAQLKQAQSRNLAQQMAAIQAARGGSAAANQRAMMQSMGRSGRELASQAAIERLAERDRFLQAAQEADRAQRETIAQQAELAAAPKKMMQEAEMARYQTEAANIAASKQRKSNMLSGLISGGAAILASDEDNKNMEESSKSLDKSEKNKKAEKAKNIMEAFNKGFKGPQGMGESLGGSLAQIGKNIFAKPAATPSPIMADAGAAGTKAVPGLQMMQPLMGGLGTSDEDKKSMKKEPDIRDKFETFLDKLDAKSYTYKDPSAPGTAPGKRYGIVAQDLEKSEVGKSIVKDTPHGKMVDTVQGFGAIVASQAELNRRLKELEKKKGKA